MGRARKFPRFIRSKMKNVLFLVSIAQPGMTVMGNLGQPAIGVHGGQGILAQPGVGNTTVYSVAPAMAAAPPQYSNQQLGLNIHVCF